jgi:hypothetical protein
MQCAEIWVDGSSDGSRAAWAAFGRKPKLLYGTARDISCGDVDRRAARQALKRLGDRLDENLLLVSDRQDNASHPVLRHPKLTCAWRSRRHPLIRHFDRIANTLRRALPKA